MAFEVLKLTDAAKDRVREILGTNESAESTRAEGIRVGVKNGGCAGMEYTIDLATEVDPKDDVVIFDGGQVFVAPNAVLFLLGTEMDYEVTTLRTGFVFNNPNQVSSCGCGESVEIVPAKMPEATDS
jgi:iron-sulfur cluster assembly protein